MLAEINLLPQKQKRDYTNLLIAASLIVIIITTVMIIVSLGNQKNKEISALQQEYTLAQKQTEVLQQQANQSNASSAVSELEKAISWSERYPVDFVPILNELTNILPEKGYFYGLDYENSSSLNLLIQFESSREAAFYLSRLKELEILETVKLSTIETVPLQNEDETVPRYLATYQLLIDRTVLKAIQEEDNEK
ncbi:type IV pilus assembly protein PilN [Metabacillus crassostreae]|uniref:hypothetical protein n=1 Tax=Metabacillus crassostreae TaxID=929098 RepID=UPI001956116D|nr:hypothetical protein [Metabacillus crassostreae]MBM7605744.1 type IV pilus assembly protein PilN [Metabacillus crassostreae]